MAAFQCIFSSFFVYTHCIDRDWVPNAADDVNAEVDRRLLRGFLSRRLRLRFNPLPLRRLSRLGRLAASFLRLGRCAGRRRQPATPPWRHGCRRATQPAEQRPRGMPSLRSVLKWVPCDYLR